MNYWIIIILTILSALYAFCKMTAYYSYWEVRGVKQLKTNALWGNFGKLKTMHNSQLLQEVYDEFKGKVLLAGTYIYTRPIAVILDLDLVKTVLIKDFNTFSDRNDNHYESPLSQHLFSANSKIWRGLRTKLTPTFTSGKMKFMFPTIVEVAQKLVLALEKEIKRMPEQCIEMYDMNARYSTDVIGTCVFGVECNSLKDPNVEFRQMGRKVFGAGNRFVKWRLLQQFYFKYLKFLGAHHLPQDIESFFLRIVEETVVEREKKNIHRNDFIDILIELKNQKDENGKPMLSLNLIAAQLLVFFAAGFETSSSNMTYCLYELAKNPDKQDKLRQEILQTLKKHNNELTYESMKEISYLDQVIFETLRLHPALAALPRICMEDYQVPETDITLEKGTIVYIPVKAIHYDPEIYENPHQFRPERFEPDQVHSRHPQSFLGFGDGPRNCIGLRFGQMEVKVGLISVLSKYRFSVSPTAPELEISTQSFVLVPAKGVWLRADKL